MEMTLTPPTQDFSIANLVLEADPIVQGVMAILVLASIISWIIIFEKVIAVIRLGSQAQSFERIAGGKDASNNPSPFLTDLIATADTEFADASHEGESAKEIRARIEQSLKSTARSELRRHERGLSFLATVGSTAPFVGLLGTVWGIMNSFTSIAQAKDTSLAVVAPGIAEALFATALGLIAAIPAVIAYNQTAVALNRTSQSFNSSIAKLAKRKTRPPG